MRRNFRQPKHRRVRVRLPPSWIWIRDDKLTLVKSGCAKMFGELFSHIVVFDSKHIYLDTCILIDQRFSWSQMIIEFASEVSNLAWRVSQSQNSGAIFTVTKWSLMFGSVVFDYQWCILIVMSVKSSFYHEYDIKNNEKHVLWAQRSFQNHHQTFHDWCPEKMGPFPKKADHWFTRTCSENMGLAPTWWYIPPTINNVIE